MNQSIRKTISDGNNSEEENKSAVIECEWNVVRNNWGKVSLRKCHLRWHLRCQMKSAMERSGKRGSSRKTKEWMCIYIYMHIWAHSQNRKKISIDESPWVMENILDEHDILARTRWTKDFVNYVKILIFIPSMRIKHWENQLLTKCMQISSYVLKLFSSHFNSWLADPSV